MTTAIDPPVCASCKSAPPTKIIMASLFADPDLRCDGEECGVLSAAPGTVVPLASKLGAEILALYRQRARLQRDVGLAIRSRDDHARALDAERASAAERIEEHARAVVAGIAGAMGLDAWGEGPEVHARILAHVARLTPRGISGSREERIREENAARALDGASVGPEADVRDLLALIDHERIELARIMGERDNANLQRDYACTERDTAVALLDALRAAVREHLRGRPKCGACGGRGMVLAAREVEEACDECVARDVLATMAKGSDRG